MLLCASLDPFVAVVKVCVCAPAEFVEIHYFI